MTERPGELTSPATGSALWALAFRPFYLLASFFAALSIGLWGLQFAGALPRPYLQGPLWHAHEMLFGFALAVIVGFLFTAGRVWSNQPTPAGRSLAGFALLWLAGRVLVLTPYGWAAALVNVAFPLAAGIALAVPFIAARNGRNYFFVALLLALALAALVIHLEHLGVLALPGWIGITAATDILLFILAVMGGRVIPMFTNNGIPGAGASRRDWLDKLSLSAVLALLALDVVAAAPWLVGAVALTGAAAHLARWALWRPWKTAPAPLVWILHAAYAWIPLHLLLRALAAAGWVSSSVAVHALTVGAAGGLIIGMMVRTSRGHTGRPLRADGWDTACFALVLASAVVRVLVPLAWPQGTLAAIAASALLWSAGFALFTVCYWKVLTRPRLDGKPG